MKPSDLSEFLHEAGIRPRKSLSQTFLIDGNILDKIISTADVSSKDHILEIGPGPGAITERLLSKGSKVTAVEMDATLGNKLSRFAGNLTVIIDDCMHIDITNLFSGHPGKVVANIPYQLTAPILAMLLPLHKHLTTLTLVMQKEVATRIVAKPGSKTFSPISILAQYYSVPKLSFSISPNSFYPKPKIESAVVHFTLKKPDSTIENTARFFHIVHTAFQQRRKMLTTSLKNEISRTDIHKVLKVFHLPETARPENLTIEAFAALAKCPIENAQ